MKRKRTEEAEEEEEEEKEDGEGEGEGGDEGKLEVDLEKVKQIKSGLHYYIAKICEEEANKMEIGLSRQTVNILNELVFEKATQVYSSDLESFAKHARRATIQPDDVKLLARRQPQILSQLEKILEDSDEPTAKKKRTTKTKADKTTTKKTTKSGGTKNKKIKTTDDDEDDDTTKTKTKAKTNKSKTKEEDETTTTTTKTIAKTKPTTAKPTKKLTLKNLSDDESEENQD
eukprot:TRINITY_DN3547_c0_g1_i1.p1 TRINITY_DN3547_c0_g1~~TRINITY_DN3547_c0_g1_i1.p1  ORF type:complete len:230 (+),score=93.85 TRINITY_DN3547_c0_g1_i1:19-708(+)